MFQKMYDVSDILISYNLDLNNVVFFQNCLNHDFNGPLI